MKNIDSKSHVTGTSIYIDDIPEINGTLHAVPVYSTKAHARIKSIDLKNAKGSKGVRAIFRVEDIPGENQIGGIIEDEPLFASNEVHFIGQVIAMIVADSHNHAMEARKEVVIQYEEKQVISDPRIAHKNASYLFQPRVFKTGDIGTGFSESAYVFQGQVESGGQEHLYIETHGSYAVPMENKKLKVFSSTQGPNAVQKTIAKVLGIPMHMIEVDVTRLGGAFGGKEDQATIWAVMASLAAYKLQKPVKLILDRKDDIKISGKRHPYSSDFKIGLDKDFKIIAFEVSYFQNGGAAADLSPAILERTLLHATNSYFIPNVKASAYSCKTNLTPFTAFRGFGGPQAMFVIESAISLAAEKLKIDKSIIQKNNLIRAGNHFHYGQLCESYNSLNSWMALDKSFAIEEEKEKIKKFNSENKFVKKGISIMPICFGISFTKIFLNQARVLVHVYSDGSIGVSTGAIEMGQGVNTKMIQVAAKAFNVDPSKINIESTNTSRVANSSPTAASSASDLNGKALQIACKKIKKRLLSEAAGILDVEMDCLSLKNGFVHIDNKQSKLQWEELVSKAYMARINLSAVGHYSTPGIYFDTKKEKGHPFAYHVFGSAATCITLDCMTGVYEIEKVNIVHDFGNSMNPSIDIGQVEGALLQGIGWMTIEELKYNEEGILLSDSLSKYKVPDLFMAPSEVNILPLKEKGPELAILKSKAVGEPPFMYGIGSYFAIQEAIKAFNPSYIFKYDSPLTPEKVLLGLYES